MDEVIFEEFREQVTLIQLDRKLLEKEFSY